MLNHMTAYLSSRFPEVEVPKPSVPDADTVVDKSTDLGDWLAGRDESFWLIFIVLLAAAVVVTLLKRPFWRGMFACLIVIGIVGATILK